MKKCILLGFLFFTFISILNAQVYLNVSEIKITNTSNANNDSIKIVGDDEGPSIMLKCYICNKSNSTILLYPSSSIISIEYTYKGKKYLKDISGFDIWSRDFIIRKQLKIKKNDSVELVISNSVFWNTPILKNRKYNYKTDVLNILPSLSVIYSDKNRKLISKGFKNIIFR
jgi:hypothetical protein